MPQGIEPSILVIFGLTGNLARNKLAPALYHLAAADQLPHDLVIIGIERHGVTEAEYLKGLAVTLEQTGTKVSKTAMARLASQFSIEHIDIDKPGAYEQLRDNLNKVEDEREVCLHRLFYLAVPPEIFPDVVHNLGTHGLHTGCRHGVTESRLLIEKPFGRDLASAEKLVHQLYEYFDEDHIYRIDHYLAKETVQNILTFRFNNPLFEAVWDKDHIERVIITAAESIGIEWRSEFYEQTGALRDIIQSHLLQVLALVAMEEPTTPDAAAIHTEKTRLLDAVTPITTADVNRLTVRGQYDGYREEAKNPASYVETYAATKLAINNDRWRGVPFVLQTGKAMAAKTTDITIIFAHSGKAVQNILKIQVQPNEGIVLTISAKQPGFDDQMKLVEMDFSYNRSFGTKPHDAYERVLIDALRGDKALFTTTDSVLAAWRIVDDVVAAWAINGDSLERYQSGTNGPAAAQILLASD